MHVQFLGMQLGLLLKIRYRLKFQVIKHFADFFSMFLVLTYIFLIYSKSQIFKKYIEIELQLGNMDRCRKLYEKYLEWSPENCYAWSKYAELERSLMETERARAIFELAIAQPALDMPELLWKVNTSTSFYNLSCV